MAVQSESGILGFRHLQKHTGSTSYCALSAAPDSLDDIGTLFP